MRPLLPPPTIECVKPCQVSIAGVEFTILKIGNNQPNSVIVLIGFGRKRQGADWPVATRTHGRGRVAASFAGGAAPTKQILLTPSPAEGKKREMG